MLNEFIAKHYNKLIVAVVSLAVVILIWMPAFDMKGEAVIDSSFNQAMLVFGTAKALNGVISLAQGTEVGPPGITVSIGEILDPINDLVEQFSWVMLVSMTSLGIQKILMNIVTNELFDILFLIILILTNVWMLYRFKRDERVRDLFFKFTIILVFLRISVPMMAVTNELTYTYFVKPEYNIEQLDKSIKSISDNVHEINTQSLPGSEAYKGKSTSLWEKVTSEIEQFYDTNTKIFQSEFYQQKMDQYQNAASQATEQIVQLIIVFIFQTILFPLFFLFLLYAIIKKIFGFGT